MFEMFQFLPRTIVDRNSLPQSVVEAKTVQTFVSCVAKSNWYFYFFIFLGLFVCLFVEKLQTPHYSDRMIKFDRDHYTEEEEEDVSFKFDVLHCVSITIYFGKVSFF